MNKTRQKSDSGPVQDSRELSEDDSGHLDHGPDEDDQVHEVTRAPNS